MKKSPHLLTADTPLRRHAETRLRERSGQNGDGHGTDQSTADPRRLLHELQVHQIELEMQNEELRQARDEMEAGLEKYSELYDFAPVGYLTLDRAGIIREANLTAASLLGIPRISVANQRLAGFVVPADRPVFDAFHQRVAAGSSQQECDVQLQVKGKPTVAVRLRANRFDSGEGCRVAVTDITQHKRAEAAVRESEERFRVMANAMPQLAWIARPDGHIIWYNQRWHDYTGTTLEQMQGWGWQSVHDATVLPKVLERWKASLALGQTFEMTFPLRGADGTFRPFLTRVIPLKNAANQVVQWFGTNTDVYEIKQVEEKMRISEVRYRRLFEASKDGILILDPQTRKIAEANPFIVKMLGYAREQLIGKELWQIGLLKDEAASQEAFRELKRKAFIRYEDLPLETRGGQRRQVEFVSNLYDEGGKSVIQCNIRDITERKHAEEALHASEERYRTLFTSIDEGYCVIEMIFDQRRKPVDYRFLAVNPAFGKQTGLVEPVGKRMRELVPEIEKHWIEFYGKVVLTGKAIRFVNEAKPMGGRWFDVYACPVGGPGSRKVAIIFNDITARRKSDEALGAARLQLTQHARMLEKTVTARTVELIATNQRLSLALDSTRLGEEQNRVLLQESRSMQVKLRQLTHQILTAQEEERKKISRELHDDVVQTLVGLNVELSALVHGNSAGVRQLKDKITRTQRLVEKSVDSVHRFARELRPTVLDDLGLIPALHAFCTAVAARKKIKIMLTAIREVETLTSDQRTVLFRVAQEALNNIARHARASRVKVTISRIPGAICLEIADNGKSFPVKLVLSAKNPKRLGLVGMRERIEMVGGKFTIESVPGKGTTVRAEVPFPPPPRKIKS